MARRQPRRGVALSPTQHHWFIRKPINETAQSDRTVKIYGVEEEGFGHSGML
jgi:hypothetical protein